MEINLIASGIEGYDEDTIDILVDAGLNALEENCIDEITTPSEIATASLIILRKILKGIRSEEANQEESLNNKKEIKRVLQELILELASTIH